MSSVSNIFRSQVLDLSVSGVRLQRVSGVGSQRTRRRVSYPCIFRDTGLNWKLPIIPMVLLFSPAVCGNRFGKGATAAVPVPSTRARTRVPRAYKR